jgi:ABC-2 type transport system permease protein
VVTTDADRGRGAAADAAAVPAQVPAPRRFWWLLRRELWESRSLYLAPLAVAGLALLGGVIASARLPERLDRARGLPQPDAGITEPFMNVSLLLMASTFIVGVFYALDALQSERRDRSILFWKSLPVSDLATVLAKVSFPVLILPLLTVALAVVVHLCMLLVGSVSLLAHGQEVGLLWSRVELLEMEGMLLYHMVALHGLWYAPFYGWLLLVSAWARRAPWLWALLPPLAIGICERIAFGTSTFGGAVLHRFSGARSGAELMANSSMMGPLAHLTPASFLVSPGLWLGLAVTAALLAAAVRLRRQRGPA